MRLHWSIWIAPVTLLVLALVIALRPLPESGRSSALPPDDALARLSAAERGLFYFVAGDYGAISMDSLERSAIPFRLVATLLTLHHVEGDAAAADADSLRAAFQTWGLMSPRQIANWPDHLDPPVLSAPLGLTTAPVGPGMPPVRVEGANLNCAFCHASPAYDASGRPDPRSAWLGVPNASINLEGYLDAVYSAFQTQADHPELFEVMRRLFPQITFQEELTLRYFVLPMARTRMAELEATTGRALPYSGGFPGATNGLDPMMARLGMLPDGHVVALSPFNSIPNLDGREFRTRFLNSGIYAVRGDDDPDRVLEAEDITPDHLDAMGAIAAYFTVPSMGLSMEEAGAIIPQAQSALHLLAQLDTPAFPGPINRARAADGFALYQQACAHCHGDYAVAGEGYELVRYPNTLHDVGSDRVRLDLVDQTVIDALMATSMADWVEAQVSQGYAAPPLNGIWASAPYLHNGSVPTLAHLLDPETRPVQFEAGGHDLDFDRVGLDVVETAPGVWRQPRDQGEPWSRPVMIDTRAPGMGHHGHEAEFSNLTAEERLRLIEFMKSI